MVGSIHGLYFLLKCFFAIFFNLVILSMPQVFEQSLFLFKWARRDSEHKH